MTTALRIRVADVVARDACSGCGLCPLLDGGLSMQFSTAGHLRPVESDVPDEIDGAAEIFDRACPGVRVSAQHPPGATRDRLLGDHVGAWEAWATDPDIRHTASSGGALTALNAWLLATGRATRVASAAVDDRAPRRTVPVTIMTREQALAASGSRYAPVATLTNRDILLPGTAVSGKPCEIAALRAAGDALGGENRPLLLSFFCAGTPSQHATDRLLEQLGIDQDRTVDALWYRGRGWPGRFTAQAGEQLVEADYEASWGSTLGPTTQWRCKVCPDGVGESADVVAADSWVTDERGYPVFDEGSGVSALIARTERGREAVMAAVADGAIEIRPLEAAHLADAQPLQTSRRRFLLARMLGSALAGRRPPRYRGFALARLGLRRPRMFVRVLRGTFRRVRSARGTQ